VGGSWEQSGRPPQVERGTRREEEGAIPAPEASGEGDAQNAKAVRRGWACPPCGTLCDGEGTEKDFP
jgi:hypothetical protein